MIFKYLSLNIWHGGTIFDKMWSFLQKENADIMALQEVYNGLNETWQINFRTMMVFQKKLKDYNSYFSPEFAVVRPEGKIDLGNAVFTRFSIINRKTIFINGQYQESRLGRTDCSDEPKNIQHLKLKIGNKKLNIFNLHGVWGFDGKDNSARLAMSKLIVEKIKDKKNVILSGDFNVRPDTKTIRNIEKHLTNVFKGRLKTTFNMKRKPKKGGYKDSVVDMVFHSSDITLLDSYCPQLDISDHMPLVCKFEV